MLLSIRKLCVYDTNPPRSVNKKLTLRQNFVDGASAIFDTQIRTVKQVFNGR